MNLSKFTIDALEFRAQVALDTLDSGEYEEDCKVWANACSSVAKEGTVDALGKSREAMEELHDYIADLPKIELNAIIKDLCLAGFFEEYDPDAECTRKLKTRVVNGVKYVTGI